MNIMTVMVTTTTVVITIPRGEVVVSVNNTMLEELEKVVAMVTMIVMGEVMASIPVTTGGSLE